MIVITCADIPPTEAGSPADETSGRRETCILAFGFLVLEGRPHGVVDSDIERARKDKSCHESTRRRLMRRQSPRPLQRTPPPRSRAPSPFSGLWGSPSECDPVQRTSTTMTFVDCPCTRIDRTRRKTQTQMHLFPTMEALRRERTRADLVPFLPTPKTLHRGSLERLDARRVGVGAVAPLMALDTAGDADDGLRALSAKVAFPPA